MTKPSVPKESFSDFPLLLRPLFGVSSCLLRILGPSLSSPPTHHKAGSEKGISQKDTGFFSGGHSTRMEAVWKGRQCQQQEYSSRSSCAGSAVRNLTSIHEDAGLIPGLAQWVKEPAVVYVGHRSLVAVAWAGSCCSDWTPSLRISICYGCGPKMQT